MHHKTIGFIGGGRITGFSLEGWTRAGTSLGHIVVSDPDADSLARLQARFPAIETALDNSAAAAQDLVLLAVHPRSWRTWQPHQGPPQGGRPGAVGLTQVFTMAKLTEPSAASPGWRA